MSRRAEVAAFKSNERKKALAAHEAAVAKAAAALDRRLQRIPEMAKAFSKRLDRLSALAATEERNERICGLYDQGKSYAEIAELVGLSRAQVKNLAARSQRARERKIAADEYAQGRQRARNFAKLADDARYGIAIISDHLSVPIEEMTPLLVAGLSAIEASRLPGMTHDMVFALKYVLDENDLAFSEAAKPQPALWQTSSAPEPSPDA